VNHRFQSLPDLTAQAGGWAPLVQPYHLLEAVEVRHTVRADIEVFLNPPVKGSIKVLAKMPRRL